MGKFSDLCLVAPKREEKSLDQLVETCSSGSCVLEDRISYLSDDILLVILSFLTMNDVAKTSLLSRRWLNVWIYTPVLNFIWSPSMRHLNFVKGVNHSLARHKGQYLKEFKVVCDLLDNNLQEDIDSWFAFALSRKVERLELNFLLSGVGARYTDEIYYFPDRFLQFDLKLLKSLSLQYLCVSDKAVNFFLMNCPFLERLELVGVYELTNLVISGLNLVLKYLRIQDCCDLKVLSISNANLVSLEISPRKGITLTNLPMLVELSISGVSMYGTSRSLGQFGSCYSQLEVLTLRNLDFEELINLTYLDRMTKLKRLFIEVDASYDESLTILISIINSCPSLEEFILMLDWGYLERSTRNIYYVEGGSSLLQSKSLKVFEFLGYYGRVSDVELVIRVVENAPCLEKIILDPRNHVALQYHCYSESAPEREARSFALNQLEALRETQSIPPHVDVIIR